MLYFAAFILNTRTISLYIAIPFIYDSKVAQRKTKANLVNSRKSIDLDSDEFDKLDSIIKKKA